MGLARSELWLVTGNTRPAALVFGLWAILAALIVVVRPGALLEFAAIGIVGSIAWGLLRPIRDRLGFVLGVTCMLLPLMNTWPVRVYQTLPDRLVPPLPALLAVSSLAALLLVALRPDVRWRDLPKLPAAAAAALLVGGVLATIASSGGGVTLGALWIGEAVPVTIAMIVVATVRRSDEAWRLIGLVGVGALVPLLIAVAAYALSFGIPSTGDDLLRAKVLLYRPHLIQEMTFGNLGHLADFALLVMPLALVGVTRSGWSRGTRGVLILTAGGAVAVLIVTLSRSALLVAILAALALVLAFVLRRSFREATPPLVVFFVLAAVSFSPPIRMTFGELLPRVGLGPASPSLVVPGATFEPTFSTSLGPITVAVEEPSEIQRLDSVAIGIGVFARHMPFGVGPGQYEAYDRAHSASHSILVESLAEEGILGILGFFLLVAFIVKAAVRAGLRARDDEADTYALRVAALAGAGGFLLHGIVAGAAMAIGPVNVWASLFWLEIGLAGAAYGKRLR